MATNAIMYQVRKGMPFGQLLALYDLVGWAAYTNEQPCDKLAQASRNSTYIIIGLSRFVLLDEQGGMGFAAASQ